MSVYSPNDLEIVNESDLHSGPKGRESHFKVFIVSEMFKGLKSIDKQKHVYETLKDIMPRIHALALKTLSPDQLKSGSSFIPTKSSSAVNAAKKFKSPNCSHKVPDSKSPKK